MRLLILSLLLALSACASETTLPVPHGPWHVLNSDQWDIDPATISPPGDLPEAP